MKFVKRESKRSEGSGRFLKIGEGESVTGVFRGEVYEFYSKWVGTKGVVTSENDPEGRIRFRCNFVTRDGDMLKAKIWEFPEAIYNQLANLSEDYPLETTVLKITRRGMGTDTTYTIIPTPNQSYSGAFKEQVENLPLNILEHKE